MIPIRDYSIELVEPLGNVIAQVPTAKNRRLTLSTEEGDTFSFSVSGKNPVAKFLRDMITDVNVYCDNIKIFRGRIVQTTDQVDGTADTVNVSCVDYKTLLKRRYFYVPNKGTVDTEEHAWQAINYTQTRATDTGLGITRGENQATNHIRTATWEVGGSVRDFIDGLAKTASAEDARDYFEWHIDPELVFRCNVPGRGREVPVFTADYGGTVLSFDTGFDPNSYANIFRVQGGGSVLTWLTTQDYGRWPGSAFEEFINDSTISSINQSDAAAFWAMTHHGQLDKLRTYNLEISSARWGGPSQLWIGDFVYLDLKSGRVNVNTSDFRVLNMHLEIDDAGMEHIAIEVGFTPTATYRDFNRMSSFMLHHRRQVLAQRATWFKRTTQGLQSELAKQERARGRKSYPANAARRRLNDFKVVYSKWQKDQTQRG